MKMLLLICAAFLLCEETTGLTTSTESMITTLDPSNWSICNVTNPCLNGGTCHDPLYFSGSGSGSGDCSTDPGMGPAVCVCPAGFKGHRCEVWNNDTCGTEGVCKNHERCLLVDVVEKRFQCVDDYDSSDITAPHCASGVQRVNYTFDPNEREKPIVCLDMYYTNSTSLCYDLDTSLDFEIGHEEVPDLFCLRIDFTEWKTCLRINNTFHSFNFPDKPELDVTLITRENDLVARSASITFRVLFNTPPSVSAFSKSYLVNMGLDRTTFSLDLANEFGVTDDNSVTYSLEVNDARLQIDPYGVLQVQLKDQDIIVAKVKITDNGVPSLSTSISVIVEVLTLDCNKTKTIFYVDSDDINTSPVGTIQCTASSHFPLIYSSSTSLGINVHIEPNGTIMVAQGSPGDYKLKVKVTLQGKFTVQLPDIDVVIREISTCGVEMTSETWKSEYEIASSTEAQGLMNRVQNAVSDSLSSTRVQVNVLLLRKSSDSSGVNVYFLVLNNNKEDHQQAIRTLEQQVSDGKINNLPVNTTSLQTVNKVGLVQIEQDIAYSSRSTGNTHMSTMNNTFVEMSCSGFFLLPVGEVTVEWRVTSEDALVVPLPLSRFQTSESTPGTNLYSSTLKVSNILYRDSGLFTCRITDDVGNAARKSLQVHVVAPPIVSLSPIGQVFIQTGETITLTCSVSVPLDTDTTITWYQNNVAVKNEIGTTSQYEAGGSTSDYSCRGANLVGIGDPSSVTEVVVTDGTKCEGEGEWPSTIVGTRAESPCQAETTGLRSRECSDGGVWLSENTTQCVSDEIREVLDDIQWLVDGVQVGSLSILSQTLWATTQPETLGAKEVELVTESLDVLLDISRSYLTMGILDSVTFTKKFINVATNLLDQKTAGIWKSISMTPSRVMSQVDSVTEVAADALIYGEVEVIETDSIDIQVGKTDPRNFMDIEFPSITVRESETDSNSFLFLAASTVEKNSVTKPTSYSSVFYKHLYVQLPTGKRSSDNTTLVVNSHILALNVFTSSKLILSPPLNITFEHQNRSIDDLNPVCVFLDTESHEWDSDGCNMSVTNRTHTVCTCTHLTNFALLMDPSQEASDAVLVITEVGCSLCIIFLLLTIIIYVIVWRHVKSNQSILLLIICACLSVCMLLILVGINKTSNMTGCKAVAVLLHFFYLVAFFSMLAYGLDIVFTVAQILPNRSKIIPLIIGSWLFPVAIVAITMASTSMEGYGSRYFCWFSIEESLIWAYVVPAFIVVIINFVVIGKLVHSLLTKRKMLDENLKKNVKQGLHGICILVPILGVSWVIGILAFGGEMVYQYVFAILNIIMGLFVFVTQCCCRKKVREYLSRCLCPQDQSKPGDRVGSSSGINLPLNPFSEENSAYSNLLGAATDDRGREELNEGTDGIYDLPEGEMQTGSRTYQDLDTAKRMSNVYLKMNQAGSRPDADVYENESGRDARRTREPSGYDDSYATIQDSAKPPLTEQTSGAYYNLGKRKGERDGLRPEPLGRESSSRTYYNQF